MSALANWFEQAGLRSVVIGLIREHMQITRPPRALWVPFELGRPLGPPANDHFQQNVLRQALSLIETARQPVLTDFASEDPRASTDPHWQPPATEAATTITAELHSLQPLIAQFEHSTGRSSIGVSGCTLESCARIVDQTLASGRPQPLSDKHSALLGLRYAIDDLKAGWIEAALTNGRPSSRQIHDWLWLQSALGRALRQLRRDWMDGDDPKLAGAGARFMVPHRWRV